MDADEEDALHKDDIFHILQNERRRQVLRHLRDVEDTVEMRKLAETIAAWENDTTIQNLYSDQRQRVYIALYQSHLPKLDELGVIEYNQARGIVRPTDRVADIVRYLDTESTEANTPGDDPPITAWTTLLGAVAGVALLLGGAALLGVFPVSVAGLAAAIFVTGIVSVGSIHLR